MSERVIIKRICYNSCEIRERIIELVIFVTIMHTLVLNLGTNCENSFIGFIFVRKYC